MRNIYLIGIILFFFNTALTLEAQEFISDILKFDGSVLLSEDYSEKRNILFVYDRNGLHVLNTRIINESDSAFLYYLNDNHSYRLIVPTDYQNRKLFFPDFINLNNKMYLLEFRNIFVFEPLAGSDNYRLSETTLLPKPFISKIEYFQNDFVLLNSFLCASNREEESQVYICKFHPADSLYDIHHFTNPSGFMFTSIWPRNILDYYKGMTALSDADNYLIRIYDQNYNLKDSISRKTAEWVKCRSTKTNRSELAETNTPKAHFGNLMEDMKNRSLISSINFIDSNRIFVSWTIPPGDDDFVNYYVRYDLWERKSGNWKLKYKDLKDYRQNDKDSFSSFFPISTQYRISGGRLLKLVPFPFDNPEEYYGETNSSVEKMKDQYYMNHKLRYSIFIYEFK